MLIQNPTMNDSHKDSPYCAIRSRNKDGTVNVGGNWLEPMGSVTEFVENQTEYEVVFYGPDDKLPE